MSDTIIRHTRPSFAVETEILDPKTIAADDAANSGITNTTVVYDDRESPTPHFYYQTNTAIIWGGTRTNIRGLAW